MKYANTAEHCIMLRNDATQSVVKFILHDKHKNSNFFFKAIKFKIFSLDSLAYFCHICLYFSQHNSLINNFWKLDSLICKHQLTESDNSFFPKLQNEVQTWIYKKLALFYKIPLIKKKQKRLRPKRHYSH